MLVACGPFTTDADTGYKPWRGLLHQIKAQKPDVLLLVCLESTISLFIFAYILFLLDRAFCRRCSSQDQIRRFGRFSR